MDQKIEIPNLEDELKDLSDEQIKELFERTDGSINGRNVPVEDLVNAFAIVWAIGGEFIRRGKSEAFIEELFGEKEKKP